MGIMNNFYALIHIYIYIYIYTKSNTGSGENVDDKCKQAQNSIEIYIYKCAIYKKNIYIRYI